MTDDSAPASPRTLLIIGGAEDKVGRVTILRRFVRLAGGSQARIVLIPTASSIPAEMEAVYSKVFRRLRVRSTTVVNPADRIQADDPALVQAIDEATGVFITGGNQLKLGQFVVGTPTGDAIIRAYQRGAVVAGTSAGASVMSQFMISLGDEGVTPRQRTSQMSMGLALLPQVIIDQHFDQRGRYGRLLSLVAVSPSLLGMGIDEDTAVEVVDGDALTVVGSGAVFLVDARHALTDAHEAADEAPLLVSGATVHSLPTGSRFSLARQCLIDFTEGNPDPQARRSALEKPDDRATDPMTVP